MKKIFTIAAALLASFSLMAADATFTMSEIFDGNNQSAEVTEPVAATVSTTASKSNAKDGKLGSDGNYFQIVLADATFSAASLNGYINTTATDKNWAFQFSFDGGANWTDEALQANDGNKTSHDIEVAVEIPLNANGFRVVRRAGTSTIVNSITLTLGAPSTDPVTEVTISGPTEAYIGQAITLKATTDAPATEIFWTVDGSIEPGETSATFVFTPTNERTYHIGAWARNEYNAAEDYAVGSIDVVSIEKPILEACAALFTATEGPEASKGAEVALKEESYGGKIIFADAKDDNFAVSFIYTDHGLQMCKGGKDSVRVVLNNKLQEGSVIELTIYQSTIDEKTRGFKLQNLAKSTKLDASWVPTEEDKERVFEYEVKAGDGLEGTNKFIIARNNTAVLVSVLVSGCGDPIDPTAIDNTEVGVKAVKMIENGQLVIIKNGVKYNAQGTIVK